MDGRGPFRQEAVGDRLAMIRCAFVILDIVLVLLFSHCNLLKRKTPLEKELKQAEQMYNHKQFAKALEHYSRALELKRDHPGALLGLARTHIALGNQPAARSTLKKIISINPTSSEAQQARAILTTIPEKGIPKKIVRRKIEDLLEGRKLEELTLPEVTPETKTQALSFYQRGISHLQKGKIDFAIALLQKSEELNPSFPPAYVALGVAFMKKGMFDHAVSQLRQAVTLDPTNVEARFNLGLIYEGKGQWELARDEYMQVLPFNVNNPLIYTRLGLVFMELGLPSAAVDAWRIASAIDPHFIPARLLLAKAYADVGQAGFVPISYSLSYDSETHRLEITRQVGTERLDFTFYDAAVSEYKEVLHMAPKLAEAYYGLGTTYARAVQNLVPILYFDGIDHRDPYDGRLRLRMSPEEMLEQAIRRLKTAVSLDPTNAVYRTNLGVVYAEAGQYRNAIKEIKTAIRLDKELLASRGVLGVLLSYVGQLQRSQQEYGRLGRVHPDVIRAMESLNALQQVKVPAEPVLPSPASQGGAQTPGISTPFSGTAPSPLPPGTSMQAQPLSVKQP